MFPRAFACLAVFVFSGCATFQPRACPKEGGAPWRKLTTAHFELFTNLDVEAARATAARLEQIRTALVVAIGTNPTVTARVIVLRDSYELRRFADKAGLEGFATRLDHQPLIVFADQGFEQSGAHFGVAEHEIAHQLFSFRLVRQPRWLAEGLATYFESIELEDGKIRVGRPPRDRFEPVKAYGPLPVKTLRTGTWDKGAPTWKFYSSAWAFVHMLENRHPDRLGRWLNRLGAAEDPAAAWDAEFAGLSDAKLDAELADYLLEIPPVAERTFSPPTVRIEESVVPESELHVRWAELFMSSPSSLEPADKLEAERGELALALAADPLNPEARLRELQLERDKARRVQLAKALTESAPEFGPGWSLLGVYTEDREAALSHHRKAVANAPEDPGVLNNAAWALLNAGQPEKALPLAEAATAHAPWFAEAYDTLAFTLGALGRCGEAQRVQRRAIDLIGEGYDPNDKARYEQRRGELEQRCVPKA